jgi:hypothetical protein
MLSLKSVSGENPSRSAIRANVTSPSMPCRRLGGHLRFVVGIAAGLLSTSFLATKPVCGSKFAHQRWRAEHGS